MKSQETQNIKITASVNIIFTVVEFLAAFYTNSTAILSKGLHDFGDSAALIASWFAAHKSNQTSDKEKTFGYKRISTFSALALGVILFVSSVFILAKAIPRLADPESVNSTWMIIVACLGLLFNGVAFWQARKGSSVNENMIGWHLLEDIFGWSSILLGSIAIYLFNYPIIDPLITIGYSLFIMKGVYDNLQEVFNILLQGVPEHINFDQVEQTIKDLDGVLGVHDIHIWSLDGKTDIFTGHIVVEEKLLNQPDDARKKIKSLLKDQHIEHSTIELESSNYCSGIECD